MNIAEHRRIMIIGNYGSGKSYLARALADVTGLPVVHLDRAFFQPGWKIPPAEEWTELHRQFIAQERWIIDGMWSHGDTLELRCAAADLIIFLDINRFVCLAGVLTRIRKPREDMLPCLQGQRGPRFLRLCRKTLTQSGKIRRDIMTLSGQHPQARFLVIRSRRETMRLLNQWRTQFS